MSDATTINARWLLDLLPVGVFQTESAGRCVYVNRRCVEMLDTHDDALLGYGWTTFIHPEDREELFAVWNHARETATRFRAQYRFLNRTRGPISVIGEAAPVVGDDGNYSGHFGCLIDITNEQRLEDRIRQARKMEILGSIAGGLAHSFNNHLTAITGGLDVARAILGTENDEVTDTLDIIMASADQASALSRQLLSIGRRDAPRRTQLDPVAVLLRSGQLVRSTFPPHIEVSVIVDASDLVIDGDVHQIEQALLNVALNARDSMPEGGKLDLRLTEHVEDVDVSIPPTRTHSRSFVVFEVRDTGTGMPPEIVDHIFEPFFTTKDSDRGTGLGLAMVQSTAHGHGGWVTVESREDQGTCLRIFLPARSTQSLEFDA